MKKVEALIKPFTLDALKTRLEAIGIHDMSVEEVRGAAPEGPRKGSRARRAEAERRGVASAADFVSKLRVEIVVIDGAVPSVVEALLQFAGAGRGKEDQIFIQPIEEVVRIRTGERGEDAL
jgi:nitrogen regulatory protein P-II 1